MGGGPPTDHARLQLFRELVTEYDGLADAFPVDQRSFNIGGPPRPPSDRWARTVRAMALRKFTLATTDDVYVGKVLSAFGRLVGPDHEATVDHYRDALAKVGRLGQWNFGEGGEYGADELVVELIYGGLLHGDWAKWQRVRGKSRVAIEATLWEVTRSSEILIRDLSRLIELAYDEQLIQDPAE